MKGAVVSLDRHSGELSSLYQFQDSFSADSVLVDDARAAFVSHSGEFARIAISVSEPEVCLDDPLYTKVRAALRTHVYQGRAVFQIATADGVIHFRFADDGAICPARIVIESAPKITTYGVVAAPLLFTHDYKDYLFYGDRAERALCASLTENRVVWSMPLPYGVDSDPLFDPVSGMVLFSSGESLLGGTTGNLYAYDVAAHALRWQIPLGGGADTAPVVLTWHGTPAVATATLKNANVYVVSLAEGRILYQYAIPETGACQHKSGACVPIGYSGYHTQTNVCKVYAQPIVCVHTNGDTALLVLSNNGNGYWLVPGSEAVIIPLGGAVRASAAPLSETALLIHAGTNIQQLTLPEGWRILAQPLQAINIPETPKLWRFSARNTHLRLKRLRRTLRRRLFSDRDS